jgi:hypothetical protein
MGRNSISKMLKIDASSPSDEHTATDNLKGKMLSKQCQY